MYSKLYAQVYSIVLMNEIILINPNGKCVVANIFLQTFFAVHLAKSESFLLLQYRILAIHILPIKFFMSILILCN